MESSSLEDLEGRLRALEKAEKERTLYVSGIHRDVTEELLYELFVQAGPLKRVSLIAPKTSSQLPFGFIEFEHEISVPYTIALMDGIRLFGKPVSLKPRSGTEHEKKIREASRQRRREPPFPPKHEQARPPCLSQTSPDWSPKFPGNNMMLGHPSFPGREGLFPSPHMMGQTPPGLMNCGPPPEMPFLNPPERWDRSRKWNDRRGSAPDRPEERSGRVERFDDRSRRDHGRDRSGDFQRRDRDYNRRNERRR